MANGGPETEVFKAADAVLARGERPTVKRVRNELGRGSPARVGQLLEQWWKQLAQQLKGHALLPELPGEVAQAFAEAWRLALGHAGTAAEAALAEQQNTLFAEQTSLIHERKLWEVALAAAQTELAESNSKLVQAELQLVERQGLVDQLAAEVVDGRQQRDHLQEQHDRRQMELEALRTEYATTQAHVRAVEDRAHQQVDQLRQELKATRQQRERDLRDYDKRVANLLRQEQSLRDSLRTTEQEAAHQSGQVAALEATITRWQAARTPAEHGTRKALKKGTAASTAPGRPRPKDKKAHP